MHSEKPEKIVHYWVQANNDAIAMSVKLAPTRYRGVAGLPQCAGVPITNTFDEIDRRSEEHTSELQSRLHIVCRLLLEKTKNTDRILLLTSLLHLLSDMIGSVLVLMRPLVAWLTPDFRINKCLLKCNWTIRQHLPR